MGCGLGLEADKLAGFNVRMGEVKEAVCFECLPKYMTYDETAGPGWFSVALQRIVGRQQKPAAKHQTHDNVVPLRIRSIRP